MLRKITILFKKCVLLHFLTRFQKYIYIYIYLYISKFSGGSGALPGGVHYFHFRRGPLLSFPRPQPISLSFSVGICISCAHDPTKTTPPQRAFISPAGGPEYDQWNECAPLPAIRAREFMKVMGSEWVGMSPRPHYLHYIRIDPFQIIFRAGSGAHCP